MPRKRIATGLSALCLALLSTACASVNPPPRLAVQDRLLRPELPDELLTCAVAPEVPELRTEDAVARYVVALWSVGDDCRGKLARLRALIAVE
jgi:hypothetical protein